MSTLSGFPYCEVQFTKDGAVHDAGEVAALLATLEQEAITDLFVISHGWNNDMTAARALYRDFVASLRAIQNAGQGPDLSGRRIAVLGVLWPSKKFADPDVIPSGAAGLGEDMADTAIATELDGLERAIDDPHATAELEQAKGLIAQLEDDPAARRTFADTIRGVLPADAADDEDASAGFFHLTGDQIMGRLAKPSPLVVRRPAPVDTGGITEIGELGGPPAGGAAFLGGLFMGMKSAALKLVNYATYYLMKVRAGTVGREGVCPLLRQVRAQRPDVKIHLVGHSFGGRLVAATAAAAAEQPPLQMSTMTLLQAAFSHHGFAHQFDGVRDGFFRSVVRGQTVAGPMLITHTPNDQAVGLLYPLVSLLAGDDAAALGDANDPYGGIGRNGAQRTPEAVAGALLAIGQPYQFLAGRIYNLEASAFVKDHSDVTGQEVAQAVLTAVAAS